MVIVVGFSLSILFGSHFPVSCNLVYTVRTIQRRHGSTIVKYRSIDIFIDKPLSFTASHLHVLVIVNLSIVFVVMKVPHV